MCTTAAFLTAYYSCRLLVISFARVKNSEVVVRSSHIPLQFISTPLILLAYLSVFLLVIFLKIFLLVLVVLSSCPPFQPLLSMISLLILSFFSPPSNFFLFSFPF